MNHVSAFPVPMIAYNGEHYDVKEKGLTRREYFAAHIITGLLARSATGTENAESLCNLVATAFIVADKMERVSDKGSV